MPAITIRDVPEETRNVLAARAARAGQSLQEYLLRQLDALAARPTRGEWLTSVEEFRSMSDTRLDRDQLRALADDAADRP